MASLHEIHVAKNLVLGANSKNLFSKNLQNVGILPNSLQFGSYSGRNVIAKASQRGYTLQRFWTNFCPPFVLFFFSAPKTNPFFVGLLKSSRLTCQLSLTLQWLETSSMAKRSPPTGAPKAEATPAAAPAETKSRLSRELRKRRKKGSEKPAVLEPNWDTPAPTFFKKIQKNRIFSNILHFYYITISRPIWSFKVN